MSRDRKPGLIENTLPTREHGTPPLDFFPIKDSIEEPVNFLVIFITVVM
jgi:hypothetical protein